MALKDLFKRKPGGTVVGNLLRGAASATTGGLLGRGAMMLKEGETTEKSNAKLASKAGAAAMAFNNAGASTSGGTEKNVKLGATIQWFKDKWYYVAGAIVVVTGLFIFIKRSKGAKKFRRR